MSITVDNDIKKAIENDDLVFFVGAGFSTPLGFPNWTDLIIEILNQLDNKYKHFIPILENKVMDEIEVLEKIKAHRPKIFAVLKEKLRIIGDKKDKLDEHKKLWTITNQIITTNYDKALDEAKCENIAVIPYTNKFETANLEKNYLFKLHGDIDNSAFCVLFEDEYKNLYSNGDNSPIFKLKNILDNKTVVFIGFSLSDKYVKEYIFEFMKNIFNGLRDKKNFIITTNSDDFSEYNIKNITLGSYSELPAFLSKLAEIKASKEKINQPTNHIKLVEQPSESIKTKEKLPFNVPFESKGVNAIGIEKKLEEVHGILTNSIKTRIGQSASFQGMGGLGKTQLAVEYAHKYKEQYQGIVWLTIDLDIDEQLLELAEKCFWVDKNINAEVKLSIAKERYNNLTNTLFIFDNVDNIDKVEQYFINSNDNKILITSRNSIQGFQSIPLNTLDEENSLKLLIAESKREIEGSELVHAKELCTLLEGLPLALEMAGAFVGHYKYSWEQYLKSFKSKGIAFLEKSKIRGYTQHETNIANTLSLSDNLLEGNPELRDIIYLLAWGAGEAIDEKLISIELGVDEIDLIEPIQIALNLKFIKKGEEGYTLHRLVKKVWIEQEELSTSFAEKVSQNLSIYMKSIKDEFLKLRELDKASIQAKTWAGQIDNKYLKAMLIDYSAYPNYYRGKYSIALDEINSVYSLFENEKDSEAHAELLSSKGSILKALGDSKEAKPYYEKALEMNKRLYLESDHPDVAASLNNVGMVLESLGDPKEAKPYYEKALEIRKRLYPESDHPSIASSLNNLGGVLDSLGDPKEAKLYYEKALEMNKRLYPESDHPDIASFLNNIGVVLDSLKDFKGAKPYHEEALKMRKRLYPESDHPDIASSLNNMGAVLDSLGNSKEAKPYYEKALEMNKRLYPDIDHPDTAGSLINLGLMTNNIGYLEQAYKMREKLYGKNNKDTVSSLCSYARRLCSNPLKKNDGITLLKEFKKELSDAVLLNKVNDVLKQFDLNIGRTKTKRKKIR
ncbi:MAG: tetratricopeptide repeat protein [Sulfurimonas sp.]|jgi:tetratricopeptide (TPR) repeat protein